MGSLCLWEREGEMCWVGENWGIVLRGRDDVVAMRQFWKFWSHIFKGLSSVMWHGGRFCVGKIDPVSVPMWGRPPTVMLIVRSSSSCRTVSLLLPLLRFFPSYDEKIDVWSLGCILAELWTGYVLFQNDSTQSLLARVLGIVGPIPYFVMSNGRVVQDFFTSDGQLYMQMPQDKTRLHLLVPKITTLGKRLEYGGGIFFFGGSCTVTSVIPSSSVHESCAVDSSARDWGDH